jgi:hypothetical protein
MGKRNSKIFVMLLLTVLVSVAEQDVSQMIAVPASESGCHPHSSKPPATAPVSYHCCQTGHDSALLQSSLTSQMSSVDVASPGDFRPAPIATSTQNSARSLTLSSADPPRPTPLRV